MPTSPVSRPSAEDRITAYPRTSPPASGARGAGFRAGCKNAYQSAVLISLLDLRLGARSNHRCFSIPGGASIMSTATGQRRSPCLQEHLRRVQTIDEQDLAD